MQAVNAEYFFKTFRTKLSIALFSTVKGENAIRIKICKRRSNEKKVLIFTKIWEKTLCRNYGQPSNVFSAINSELALF